MPIASWKRGYDYSDHVGDKLLSVYLSVVTVFMCGPVLLCYYFRQTLFPYYHLICVLLSPSPFLMSSLFCPDSPLFHPWNPTRQTDIERGTDVTGRGRSCWDGLMNHDGQVFHPRSSPGCLATNGVKGYPTIGILYSISTRCSVPLFWSAGIVVFSSSYMHSSRHLYMWVCLWLRLDTFWKGTMYDQIQRIQIRLTPCIPKF